jgi:hypothetical protein
LLTIISLVVFFLLFWIFFGSAEVDIKMFFRHLHVHNRYRTHEDEVVWQELQKLDEWEERRGFFYHKRLKLILSEHWKNGCSIQLDAVFEGNTCPIYTDKEEHVWKLLADLRALKKDRQYKASLNDYRNFATITDATPSEAHARRLEKMGFRDYVAHRENGAK